MQRRKSSKLQNGTIAFEDESKYTKYLGVTHKKIENAKKMEEHKFIDEKERSYFNGLKHSIL